MYMQDHTGQDIAASIGSLSVDTSGLMKDITGQSINTTLGQIKTVLEGVAAPEADDVSYDNTSSGITADNVQSAIDELNSNKQNITIGGGLISPDFNSLNDNKNYWINCTGASNAPISSGFGVLEVIVTSSTTRLQRFTRYAASGSDMARTYVRYYANAQWYAWVQIY